MPSLRRRASAIDAETVEKAPSKPEDASDATKALSLAEEAEAEAAEAEAMAAAARARARAIRLRREAEAAGTEATNGVAVESEAPTDAEDETVAAETSDVVIDDPEDEPDLEPAEALVLSGRPADSRRRVVKIALMVIAILLATLGTATFVTLSVIMRGQHATAVDEQRLNAEYTAAGRQSVVTLMSLDFNQAKEDVQRIIDNSTGQFKSDFEIQAQDFIKVAQDSKVTTEVTVNSTAVESMTQDSAVVLVAATSRVTNSAGAKQEPRAWRLSVNLQRDGDQIKMSKVEFVP